MKLIKEIRDDAAILTLRGDFDSFVCGPFMDEVTNLFKNNVKYLIIDLRLVLFINSTAIGTLVKIHKEAKTQDGSLVLCRPSKFVHEVLDSLGLLSMFSMADDPETAIEELGASSDGTDMGADSSVIIDVPGQKEKCVAKMNRLEEETISLTIPDSSNPPEKGAECKVKFRLPLFKKGHYFEGKVEVTGVKQAGADLQLSCKFTSMKDDDRKSIAQFVEEMKFLRSESKKK